MTATTEQRVGRSPHYLVRETQIPLLEILYSFDADRVEIPLITQIREP